VRGHAGIGAESIDGTTTSGQAKRLIWASQYLFDNPVCGVVAYPLKGLILVRKAGHDICLSRAPDNVNAPVLPNLAAWPSLKFGIGIVHSHRNYNLRAHDFLVDSIQQNNRAPNVALGADHKGFARGSATPDRARR
jgi:hypothetical protein